MTILEVAHQP